MGDDLFSEGFMESRGIKPLEENEGQPTEPEGGTEGDNTGVQPAEGVTKEAIDEWKRTGKMPKEGAPAEGATEGDGQTQKPTFDINSFNTFFEKDFKTEDDVRSLFEKLDKYSDYDEKVTKLSEYEESKSALETRIKELEDAQDPLQWFPNEDVFKSVMLQKQFPEKDPNILNKVITSDLTKVSDLDVLIDDVLLSTPGFKGDRERARAVLYKRYGIDAEDSPENWEQVTQDLILMDADSKRREFRELADKVEKPKVVTPEEKAAALAQQKADLKASWKEPISRMAQYEKEAITDAEGNTIMEFDVPKEYRSGIKDYLESMVDNGLSLNKENLQFAEYDIRKTMVYENLPKILAAYKGQLESEWQKAKDTEEGNTTPPNTQTAPDMKELTGQKKAGIRSMLDDL